MVNGGPMPMSGLEAAQNTPPESRSPVEKEEVREIFGAAPAEGAILKKGKEEVSVEEAQVPVEEHVVDMTEVVDEDDAIETPGDKETALGDSVEREANQGFAQNAAERGGVTSII